MQNNAKIANNGAPFSKCFATIVLYYKFYIIWSIVSIMYNYVP